MIKIIKNIFSDIVLLFKNFFPWLLLKIFAWILGIFLWILSILLIWILTTFYVWWKWISIDSFNIFSATLTSDLWLNILLYFIVFMFTIWFYYSSVFLARKYLELFEEKKLKVKNIFKKIFSLKEFVRFLWINIFFSILSLLILAVFTGILFFIKDFYPENYEQIASSGVLNIFSISLAFFLVIFIYIFYRFSFSYAVLVEEKTSILKSIKHSFNYTSGVKKFFQTFALVFILILVSFPIYTFKQNYEKNQDLLWKYGLLLLQKNNWKELTWEDKDIFEAWVLRFDWKEISELAREYRINNWILLFLEIFYFSFFNWLSVMFYLSIYKNIIKKW